MLECVAQTKADFVKFMFLLEYIAGKQGYQYGIITAQAALETNFGKRILGKNLFGIKCTKSWLKSGGKCCSSLTKEEISGQMHSVRGLFRAYDSFEDSAANYIGLIKNLSRYRHAWQNRDNYKIYFKAIAEAGYATDSKYTTKCIALYEYLFKKKTA